MSWLDKLWERASRQHRLEMLKDYLALAMADAALVALHGDDAPFEKLSVEDQELPVWADPTIEGIIEFLYDHGVRIVDVRLTITKELADG